MCVCVERSDTGSNWASGASPILGCSIEISHDICLSVCLKVTHTKNTYAKNTWAKSKEFFCAFRSCKS